MDNLKLIVAGFALALGVYFAPFGLFVFTCCMPLYLYVKERRAAVREMRELNERIDHVFVLCENPDTGQAPEIGRHSGRYVSCPKRNALTLAEDYRAKLEKAGNPFYEKGELKVIEIPYRFGQYASENWDEYLLRAEDVMSDLTNAHHGGMVDGHVAEWDVYYKNKYSEK